jgi:hypothetical protein
MSTEAVTGGGTTLHPSALDRPARRAVRRRLVLGLLCLAACVASWRLADVILTWQENTGVWVWGEVTNVSGAQASVWYKWGITDHRSTVKLMTDADGRPDQWDLGPDWVIVDPNDPSRAVLPGEGEANLSTLSDSTVWVLILGGFVPLVVGCTLVCGALRRRHWLRRGWWACGHLVVEDGCTVEDKLGGHTSRPPFDIVFDRGGRELVRLDETPRLTRRSRWWPARDVRVEVVLWKGRLRLMRPIGAPVLFKLTPAGPDFVDDQREPRRWWRS